MGQPRDDRGEHRKARRLSSAAKLIPGDCFVTSSRPRLGSDIGERDTADGDNPYWTSSSQDEADHAYSD